MNFGNSIDFAHEIEENRFVAGAIDYVNDVDYFTFTATKNGEYEIYTEGNTDTVGTFYDTNQNLLATNDDDSNWNFKIKQNLVQGQVYYVGIKHKAAKTGTYTLFVKSPTIIPTEPNAGNSFDTATPIDVGDSREAWFESSQDERYFRFIPQKSGSYGFYTTGDALDTYGMLYKADQNMVITENDNSSENNHFLLDSVYTS